MNIPTWLEKRFTDYWKMYFAHHDLIWSLVSASIPSPIKSFFGGLFLKKKPSILEEAIYLYIYIYIYYICIYIYIIYTLYIIYIIYIIYQIYILYICIDIYVKKTNFNVCDHCDHQKTYIFLYRYISELYSFVSVCACEGLNVLKS